MAGPGRSSAGARPLSYGPPATGRVGAPAGQVDPTLPGFPAASQPDLVTDVQRILLVGGPLELLAMVSAMVSLVDPRSFPPAEQARWASRHGGEDLQIDAVVDSFVQLDMPETTAVLVALAELVPDERVRIRVRLEMTRRADRLPAWVDHIGRAAAYRAAAVTHVLGDGENVLVGVRLGPAHELTVSVFVDHTLGTVARDAVVVPAPVAEVLATLRAEVDDPDTRYHDIPLADARARITQAVERGARLRPHLETDEWPLCRPLVEWVARRLPEGGAGYEHPAAPPQPRVGGTDGPGLDDVRGMFLESLAASVGGIDALCTLDDRALPDEEFRWHDVADDIRPRVGAVLALCDRVCDEMLDVEHRTACRRLLARIATGDPAVFRRRSRAETAAAAVCWLVGSANDTFHANQGQPRVKDVMAFLGVSGTTPSQRAETLLRSAGIPWPASGPIELGSPDYLVSAQRRRIIGARERFGIERP
jgi:hypothetical protein